MRAGRACDFCLENEADPNFSEVVGFKRVRNAGGQNHVIAPRETGRRICGECLRALKGGDITVRPLCLPGMAEIAS